MSSCCVVIKLCLGFSSKGAVTRGCYFWKRVTCHCVICYVELGSPQGS